MRCPLDDAPMREVTRRGVKVDICPECRGVWLDRGELDHLIDADPGFDDPVQPTSVSRGREDLRDPRFGESRSRRDTTDDDRGFFGGRSRRDTSDDDRYRSSGDGRRRRKRSWLSEMFEFGE
jgi:hypothetical protein